MKRVILFLITICLFSVAQAQVKQGYLKSSASHAKTDTVTNAATVNQSLQIPGYWANVSIQPVLTKISGTLAGVVRLYGSLDGVNYVRINPTDSILVSNVATQSKIFTVSNSPYEFYRVGWTGTGTMSGKIVSLSAWKKD